MLFWKNTTYVFYRLPMTYTNKLTIPLPSRGILPHNMIISMQCCVCRKFFEASGYPRFDRKRFFPLGFFNSGFICWQLFDGLNPSGDRWNEFSHWNGGKLFMKRLRQLKRLNETKSIRMYRYPNDFDFIARRSVD